MKSNDISMSGERLISLWMTGPKRAKPSIESATVSMKMEKPVETTIMMGNRKNMAR